MLMFRVWRSYPVLCSSEATASIVRPQVERPLSNAGDYAQGSRRGTLQ